MRGIIIERGGGVISGCDYHRSAAGIVNGIGQAGFIGVLARIAKVIEELQGGGIYLVAEASPMVVAAAAVRTAVAGRPVELARARGGLLDQALFFLEEHQEQFRVDRGRRTLHFPFVQIGRIDQADPFAVIVIGGVIDDLGGGAVNAIGVGKRPVSDVAALGFEEDIDIGEAHGRGVGHFFVSEDVVGIEGDSQDRGEGEQKNDRACEGRKY